MKSALVGAVALFLVGLGLWAIVAPAASPLLLGLLALLLVVLTVAELSRWSVGRARA
ncbi:MAG TPA: hypothetical protein VKI99_19760 [Candidatus Dormibacteraeota bacterium]|nr:hypothetical protein [Candidatus Dormibacteraeota bacterium]